VSPYSPLRPLNLGLVTTSRPMRHRTPGFSIEVGPPVATETAVFTDDLAASVDADHRHGRHCVTRTAAECRAPTQAGGRAGPCFLGSAGISRWREPSAELLGVGPSSLPGQLPAHPVNGEAQDVCLGAVLVVSQREQAMDRRRAVAARRAAMATDDASPERARRSAGARSGPFRLGRMGVRAPAHPRRGRSARRRLRGRWESWR
jgi:hypothetical protein